MRIIYFLYFIGTLRVGSFSSLFNKEHLEDKELGVAVQKAKE